MELCTLIMSDALPFFLFTLFRLQAALLTLQILLFGVQEIRMKEESKHYKMFRYKRTECIQMRCEVMCMG